HFFAVGSVGGVASGRLQFPAGTRVRSLLGASGGPACQPVPDLTAARQTSGDNSTRAHRAAHTRAVPSVLPEARVLPSRDHASDVIVPWWPWKQWRSLPVATSQRRMVWS